MKLLGIVSILLFLSFLGTVLNLLLFYLSPLISQCCFDDFLHQFIVKAGLMFIAFQMIIATVLHESFSLSTNEISGCNVSYDSCLLKQKEGKEGICHGKFDDNGEFPMPETYGIKENNGVSGNDLNVEGHSLHENLSEHEMKKKVEQEKKCSNGDPPINCENGDGRVEDGEESGGSDEDEDANMLERRIEEFIARSYQKWKEELQEEKLNLLAIVNDSSDYLNQMTEAQQRKVIPRTSRPKKAKNISKKQRLQTIRRLMENMQIKAKMIKMHSHPISTRTRLPVNICHTKLHRVSGSHREQVFY